MGSAYGPETRMCSIGSSSNVDHLGVTGSLLLSEAADSKPFHIGIWTMWTRVRSLHAASHGYSVSGYRCGTVWSQMRLRDGQSGLFVCGGSVRSLEFPQPLLQLLFNHLLAGLLGDRREFVMTSPKSVLSVFRPWWNLHTSPSLLPISVLSERCKSRSTSDKLGLSPPQ